MSGRNIVHSARHSCPIECSFVHSLQSVFLDDKVKKPIQKQTFVQHKSFQNAKQISNSKFGRFK